MMVMRQLFCTAMVCMALAAPALAQNKAGEALYATHCVVCHQVQAVGVPGIAPALVGNIGRHASHEAGRAYLARVMLTGLVGPIQVDGVRYNGNMQSFAKLNDEEVAHVLTHVLSTYESVSDLAWLTPAFIAATRQLGGTPNDTHQKRSRLTSATGG
jgi:mono/diheme cytochrome c family protein